MQITLPDAARISSAVATLSLDLVEPLIHEMGLRADPASLRRAARVVVEAHRRQTDARRPMPDVAHQLETALMEEGGATLRDEVRRWLTWSHVRHLGDRPDWHHYRQAVQAALAGSTSESTTNDRGIAGYFGEVLDLAEVDAQLDAIRARPLSDWDFEMFVRRGDNPDDPRTDPFIDLRLQLLTSRFMDSLRASATKDGALDAIERFAQRGWSRLDMPTPLAPIRQVLEVAA